MWASPKALTNKASPGLNTWPYVRPLLRVSTHFVTTTRKRKLRPPRPAQDTYRLAVGAQLSASAGCGKTRCLLVRGASRRQKLCKHCMMCDFLTRYSNLNRGHDTRANRVTRHTTSSSTQPHAKQQPTNAPPHHSHRSLSHPYARARSPGEPSPARAPPTPPPAPPAVRLRPLPRASRPPLPAAPAAPAQPRRAGRASEARELRLTVSVPRHLPHRDVTPTCAVSR